MFQLISYDSSAAIPLATAAQIRSLLEAEWPDPDGEAALHPLIDPELHPTYFVLTELDHVVTYGRTIWATVARHDQRFKLYGLGDLVTRPEDRRKGHGRRLVDAATSHIHSDREADAALLLTEPNLESIYRRSGWDAVSGMRVVTGGYDGRAPGTIGPMMLFLSAAAHAARESFSHGALELPGDEW